MIAQTAAEQETLILDAVEQFLVRDVEPFARDLELADEYPHEIVEKMKGLGLFGATIGEAYGGLGLPATTYARIVERVSRTWMSVSGIFNSHLIMCAAIERFGTEAQKAEWMPGFLDGTKRLAFGLTEPNHGSDATYLETTARRSDR